MLHKAFTQWTHKAAPFFVAFGQILTTLLQGGPEKNAYSSMQHHFATVCNVQE